MISNKNNRSSLVIASLAIIISLLSSTVSAVVPYNGNQYTYYQPNGETLKVKLYGNNLHAIAETEDGYTIVRDPKTKEFTYATLSPDRNSLISSGIRVKGNKKRTFTKSETARLKKIPKKIRISHHAFKANCDHCRKKIGAPNWDIKHKQILTAQHQKKQITNKVEINPAPNNTSPSNKKNTTSQAITPLNTPSITGTRTTLVLLAQFPDRPQDVVHSVETINQLFNAVPYSGFGNATSVKGYFRIQSNNQLEVNNIVTAYFTAANPRSHYTQTLEYGVGSRHLIREGLAILEANGFNFNQLDGNNDNRVDAVSLLYAGPITNSWGEGLWPHASEMSWGNFRNHGLNRLTNFQITNIDPSSDNKVMSIGTICHEYGHALLDLPDLYPYDDNASSPNQFCLMSSGNEFHPNNISAPLKISLGWGNVIQAAGNIEQTFSLQADSNTFVRYTNPNNPAEHFIAEMRGDSYEGGPFGGDDEAAFSHKGLALYHVNENGSNTHSSIFTAHNPNTDYTTPYYILPIEKNYTRNVIPWYDAPDGYSDDVFTSGDTITSYGTPSLTFWSNSGRTISSGLDIYDINVLDSSLSFKMGTRFSNDTTPPNPNPMAWASPPTLGYLPNLLTPATLAANNPDTNAPWTETDLFRLAFVTSQKTAATSNDISFYNSFVQNLANNSPLNLGDLTWKVIGSTENTNALDNTNTHPSINNNGEPIYLLDGKTLIARNNSDLWDSTINAPLNINENGTTGINTIVATGSNVNGTSRDSHLGGNDSIPSKIEFGQSSKTNSHWALIFNINATTPLNYYALSDPIPAKTSPSYAKMTAKTASDPTEVEYYFTETSNNPGGDDSGWQDSPTYIDYGLVFGLQYTYTVKSRDKSLNQNETNSSSAKSVIPLPRGYNEWATSTFPSGNNLNNTNQRLDLDKGGLVSVLEWVLAGDPTDKTDDLNIMPTFGHSSNTSSFIYRRNDAAHLDPNTSIQVEYSSDLKNWQTATQGQFINITESNDAFAPGVDKVTVQFSNGITPNKDIFVRLKATVTQ